MVILYAPTILGASVQIRSTVSKLYSIYITQVDINNENTLEEACIGNIFKKLIGKGKFNT